jgi:hypothetical protein
MEHRFDELAKALAEGVSRREVLRRLGGGLAAAALVCLGLGNASVHGPCGVVCCPPGQHCEGPGRCVCDTNGHEPCSGVCCPAGAGCVDGQCLCDRTDLPPCNGVCCPTDRPLCISGYCFHCLSIAGCAWTYSKEGQAVCMRETPCSPQLPRCARSADCPAGSFCVPEAGCASLNGEVVQYDACVLRC